MTVRRFFKFGLIINLLLTLYFFFQQGISSGVALPHFDKFGHFCAFFVLAMCVDLGTRIRSFYAILILFGYGVAVEWIQSYIPGRDASMGDIIADLSGVSAYYFIAINSRWLKRIRSGHSE